jgi:hypothetical protein
MGTSDVFETLTRALKRYESGTGEVRHLEADRSDECGSDGELTATVDLGVPLCVALGVEESGGHPPTAATMTDDGGLQIEIPPSALPTADQFDDDRVAVEEESARVDDGTVVVRAAVRVESGDGSDESAVDAARETEHLPDGTRSSGRADAERPSADGDESPPESHPNDSETTDDGERSVPETETPSSVETESDGNAARDEEPPVDAERNEDVPPYEDTEYLRQLYEGCETFVEMADAYERDVAAETVRRYMADAGVHEPSSYDTVSNSDDADTERGSADGGADETAVETPGDDTAADEKPSEVAEDEGDPEERDPIKGIANQQIVADGVGLPDDISIEQLADAVETSMTLYEVKRELKLEQSKTRRLLKRLNLLDVVVTRLSEQDHREVSRSEIADRIRQSVT